MGGGARVGERGRWGRKRQSRELSGPPERGAGGGVPREERVHEDLAEKHPVREVQDLGVCCRQALEANVVADLRERTAMDFRLAYARREPE